MLVVLFFLLLFCLLNLEELYHNQNLHSQIRRDVSRDQTSERKTRGKKRRYFEILVFTPAGTTRRASCVCFREDGAIHQVSRTRKNDISHSLVRPYAIFATLSDVLALHR